MRDIYFLLLCVIVLFCFFLEDMIFKFLVYMFFLIDIESELEKEEVLLDYEFVDEVLKLIDEIIKEIFEYEIRFVRVEENVESVQLEMIENLVDFICNNILKKFEF